jgi:maltose O-acetyltransferase
MIKRIFKRVCHRIYITGKYLEQKKEYDQFRKNYNLHPDFRFNGENIQFFGNGKINIGSQSYIGEFSTIQAFDNCKVLIGKGCSISHNVRMYTQSSGADQDFSVYPIKNKTGDIIIGDYVWIGANVFINPGITIGCNSIVGANSVVVKDVEPFAIVGGVPARLIRYKQISDVS